MFGLIADKGYSNNSTIEENNISSLVETELTRKLLITTLIESCAIKTNVNLHL